MTSEEILTKLKEIKKGRYIHLSKVKDLGKGVIKLSSLVIRLGVNYANMKASEGHEVGSLPWGTWVNGYDGLVIEHKGNYYLRVASSYANNNTSAFYCNGKEISREDAIILVGEKKLTSHPADIYNINFNNIIALGR